MTAVGDESHILVAAQLSDHPECLMRTVEMDGCSFNDRGSNPEVAGLDANTAI